VKSRALRAVRMPAVCLGWICLGFSAMAAPLPVPAPAGILAYNTLIAGAPGAPGVNEFLIGNFTGLASAEPDFAIVSELLFLDSKLELFSTAPASLVVSLGNILADSGGFRSILLQFPETFLFTKAIFTATLSRDTVVLAGSPEAYEVDTAVTATLLPADGPMLLADLDLVPVFVTAPAPAPPPLEIPEPGPLAGVGVVCGWMWWRQRTGRRQ